MFAKVKNHCCSNTVNLVVWEVSIPPARVVVWLSIWLSVLLLWFACRDDTLYGSAFYVLLKFRKPDTGLHFG